MRVLYNGLHVQVVMWMPQNDILAHPKTRAFLSHVGANSVYEVRSYAPSPSRHPDV